MAFIIKALVESFSHGEKVVLMSSPTTIALVEGGTKEQLEVALYHMFMYHMSIFGSGHFVRSEDFLNWVNKQFRMDEALQKCGRPSLTELTGTYVRPIIVMNPSLADLRKQITFNK